jgi:hypothetical protein
MRGTTRREKRSLTIAVVMMVLAVASACATPAAPPPASHTIDPCLTGSGISCDPVQGHIATRPNGSAKQRLVLLFNGSGAQPLAYTKVLGALSKAGYHSIGIRYASNKGTGAACPQEDAATHPDCHRAFRAETVFGELVADPSGLALDSPAVSVDAANSVMNRVLQVVEHLRLAYPSEGWEQYQLRDGSTCTVVDPTYGVCALDWSKVVVMGHSMGSAIALYLAKHFEVARVAMISGPFDHYSDGSGVTVAPWIAEGGFETPTVLMFGLSHSNEPTHDAQDTVWTTLGMGGPTASVDSGSAPWGGVQRLVTSRQPACLADSEAAHNSTAQNLCTPGDPPALRSAWVTLAGG